MQQAPCEAVPTLQPADMISVVAGHALPPVHQATVRHALALPMFVWQRAAGPSACPALLPGDSPSCWSLLVVSHFALRPAIGCAAHALPLPCSLLAACQGDEQCMCAPLCTCFVTTVCTTFKSIAVSAWNKTGLLSCPLAARGVLAHTPRS